MIDLASW